MYNLGMIRNKTKKTVIAKKVFAKSFFGKIKGLIGEKTDQAITFNTRFGIHTFLLKKPIDVVVLNKNKQIAVLKSDLEPNRIFLWNIRFNLVIELPQGSLKKSKTELGDTILLPEEFRNA